MLMGLALTVAACGGSTAGGGGAPPTPTVTPSPTPTPCTGWRVIPSPPGGTYAENDLRAVSALSPTAAWAVGTNWDFGTVGPGLGLIEQWDGTAWHLLANPTGTNGFSPADSLNGVAAVSSTDVWVVGRRLGPAQPGSASPQYVSTTLILHWNGTQWSIVPSVNPSASSNMLNSVAASAANDVWAVGEYVNASNAQLPLIEHWDGAAWHVAATPDLLGVTKSTLSAVARIPGTQQLLAVGSTQKSGGSPEHLLIERWNGAAWQVVAGPTLPNGALGGSLVGVVALSATSAWAVGGYSGSGGTPRALIAHWDGATWKLVTSPMSFASLNSVAAVNASDVRAIGWFETTPGGSMEPLILQWNASVWKQVTSPLPSGASSGSLRLSSITSDGAGNYWIVGTYSTTAHADRSQTLTLHCP